MSRKKLFAILAAESVAIIALYVLTARMQETFSAIYNFPFEQIGLGLRALHGLGGFGVGAAFALWIGFSLLPMIPAVCGRRKSAWEKALLGLVSFSLLTTLYVMTDPQCIELPYTDSDYIVKTSFSMTTWSALILYFIVFAVRLMREGDRDKLMDYFGTALYALAMLCAACIIILGTGSAQNIRFSNRQTVDTAFALLQFAVAALPYVLDIMIVIHGKSRRPDKAVLCFAHRPVCRNGWIQFSSGSLHQCANLYSGKPKYTRFQRGLYAVCAASDSPPDRKSPSARR